MNSVDIAIACALLSIAVILFIFNVKPDASDSAPHRTKLDQLM
jgi:type IV secretory pathway VirB2 component (pilin)